MFAIRIFWNISLDPKDRTHLPCVLTVRARRLLWLVRRRAALTAAAVSPPRRLRTPSGSNSKPRSENNCFLGPKILTKNRRQRQPSSWLPWYAMYVPVVRNPGLRASALSRRDESCAFYYLEQRFQTNSRFAEVPTPTVPFVRHGSAARLSLWNERSRFGHEAFLVLPLPSYVGCDLFHLPLSLLFLRSLQVLETTVAH